MSLTTSLARTITAAAAIMLLTAGGAAVAGQQHGGKGDLPLDLTACVRWGDLLPVELSRSTAREAITCLINLERKEAGRRLLVPNRRLQRASQRHTARMDGTGCFRHRCPGEKRLKRRLSRYLAGSPRQYLYGEAIAWQPARLASPRYVVAELMKSPVHRFHILHPRYRDVGVGFTVGTPTSALTPGGIYTVDFGMRKP